MELPVHLDATGVGKKTIYVWPQTWVLGIKPLARGCHKDAVPHWGKGGKLVWWGLKFALLKKKQQTQRLANKKEKDYRQFQIRGSRLEIALYKKGPPKKCSHEQMAGELRTRGGQKKIKKGLTLGLKAFRNPPPNEKTPCSICLSGEGSKKRKSCASRAGDVKGLLPTIFGG